MRSMRKGQAALAAAITVVGLAGAGVALAGDRTAGDTKGVIDMSSSDQGSYSVLDLGKPGHGDRFSDISTLSLDYAGYPRRLLRRVAALRRRDAGPGGPQQHVICDRLRG
jgi:hypothetical protein